MTDLISESEDLFRQADELETFYNTYQTYPWRRIGNVIEKLNAMASQIEGIEKPKTFEELVQAELKRRLSGAAFLLEQNIRPTRIDYESIIKLIAIHPEDIEYLEGWLKEHREETIESIEKLFDNRSVQNRELQLDLPVVRQQAEAFCEAEIRKYHRKLGGFLVKKSRVGEYLHRIGAMPTTETRSYYSPLTRTIALAIQSLCYMDSDMIIHLNEKEMIRLYGHEGVGHALLALVTAESKLPHFLKKGCNMTIATEESLTQTTQEQIFDDIVFV